MLLIQATLATFSDASPYGLIRDAAVMIEYGRIVWVGPTVDAPKATVIHDMEGRLVTPAPIDCHTHLVHGGNRALEFERRLGGASYEDVARAGGGILSTVADTRAASCEELVEMALPRLDAALAEGMGTIEIKSGYGLDLDTELKMLRAARALAKRRQVRVFTSFLGAHAVPPDFKGRADTYIDDVCLPALRAADAEGLIDAVDGFCEGIAFTADQIARVFNEARGLGLPVKLHAEQLSNTGGAQLAARFDALSADHLEYASDEDVRALSVAGSVAVLLPGAFYTLREETVPPVEAFRRHNVPIALATDANPGSSPMTSLLLAANMGCTLFRLTPGEALRGITANAARALGLIDSGRIAAGFRADLAVWDVEHPAELTYRIGFNPLHQRWFNGEVVA